MLRITLMKLLVYHAGDYKATNAVRLSRWRLAYVLRLRKA